MSELRKQLLVEQPAMCAFLDQMKDEFGAVVLFVSAPTIEKGKEPASGLRPYAPLPDSTWSYKVGQSPAATAVKRKAKK